MVIKKRIQQILDKFKNKKIYGVSSNSNFYGQESLGKWQIRGNGVLILKEGEIYFEMREGREKLDRDISGKAALN